MDVSNKLQMDEPEAECPDSFHAVTESPLRPGAVIKPRDERTIRTTVKAIEWFAGATVAVGVMALPGADLAYKSDRLELAGVALLMSLSSLALRYARSISNRTYERLDRVLEVIAIVVIATLVRWTGEAASSYIALMFYPVLYVGVFYPLRGAIGVTALASIATMLPLFYDAGATEAHLMSRLVVILVAFWVLVGLTYWHRGRLLDAERKARHQALTDVLTGISNRRGLIAYADQAIEDRRRTVGARDAVAEMHGVLLVDIDDFKLMNTNYGHVGGDLVLEAVAKALSASVRMQDRVARVGGDEFTVYVNGAGEAEIAEIALRCSRAVAAASAKTGLENISLTASVGFAVAPSTEFDYERLAEFADEQMYVAKGAGRGRVAGGGSVLPASAGRPVTGPEAPNDQRDSIQTATPTQEHGGFDDQNVWSTGRSLQCLASAASWAGSSVLVLLAMAMPDADRAHLSVIAVLISGAFVIAAVTFWLGPRVGQAYYRWTGYIASSIGAVAVYLTDGASSPVLPVLFFVVAFAALFSEVKDAIGRTSFTVLMFATPFVYEPTAVRLEYVVSFLVLATTSAVIAMSIIYNKKKLVEAEEILRELSLQDPLTGLANRRAFTELLESELVGANGPRIGVCLVDLDNFKAVNTIRGHAGGDRLLLTVADALRSVGAPDDCVARIGGDEFALVLRDVCDSKTRSTAERCLAAVRCAFERERISGITSASIGYAVYPGDGVTSDQLVRAADDALMTVKEQGKSAVVGASAVAQ